MRLPRLTLARHGETAWTLTGQHTGLADIPLTAAGEADARRIADRLAHFSYAHVWTSPTQRARRTCELAGYSDRAVVDSDLHEWSYGRFEGRTTLEIRGEFPDWRLYRDGAPDGESVADATARADRVIARVRATGQDVLIFSSGHFSRLLAARWIGLPAAGGANFLLGTTSISVLGYDHTLEEPAILLWNDRRDVER